MALGNVFMRDTDGNIPVLRSNTIENVCGLIFDISGQTNFWTTGGGANIADTWKDKVIELNSLNDAIEADVPDLNIYIRETREAVYLRRKK